MNSTPRTIESVSLGECWVRASALIMGDGTNGFYDGAPIREIANVSMVIARPEPDDPFIRQHGDPDWLQWMHDNFFVQKPVAELGDAPSYAIRLFNYAGQGRDQLQWVIERLRQSPASRSATITTFMPLTDTTYIPCISLLDFWMPSDALELVVYAHSLDFGKKAYGNLVELASLLGMVAKALDCPLGQLIIHAKSVHIYQPEYAYMEALTGTGLPRFAPALSP